MHSAPPHKILRKGTGNTGLETETSLEGLSDEATRWRETDGGEALLRA